VEFLGLSKDAIHIHVGLAAFFMAVVFWKRGRIELACLVPVVILALGMEVLDLRDDMATFGHFRWSASLHDFFNTTIWPAIIVCLSKANALRQIHL